jgi:hypothetical protein
MRAESIGGFTDRTVYRGSLHRVTALRNGQDWMTRTIERGANQLAHPSVEDHLPFAPAYWLTWDRE